MKTRSYWIINWSSVFVMILAIFGGGILFAIYSEWYIVCFFTAIASVLLSIWATGRATGVTFPRNHPISKFYKKLGW